MKWGKPTLQSWVYQCGYFDIKKNIGDGRQRAEERMDNKYKNETLKHSGEIEAKIDLFFVLHDIIYKRPGFLLFGEQCSERLHFPSRGWSIGGKTRADRFDSWSLSINLHPRTKLKI